MCESTVAGVGVGGGDISVGEAWEDDSDARLEVELVGDVAGAVEVVAVDVVAVVVGVVVVVVAVAVVVDAVVEEVEDAWAVFIMGVLYTKSIEAVPGC